MNRKAFTSLTWRSAVMYISGQTSCFGKTQHRLVINFAIRIYIFYQKEECREWNYFYSDILFVDHSSENLKSPYLLYTKAFHLQRFLGIHLHIKYFWYHMCKNPNLREFEENSFNRIRNTNGKGQWRRLILGDLYLKISADKFSSVCVEH